MNGSAKKSEDELPNPSGNIVVKQEKVFVPVKENPTYNFVGRLLGPRGLTAKQLEQDLECKIMVRGQGSMRDKRKEDQNRGKPNWEHLDEELHVLVSVEDYENRADLKLRRAVETIKAFLEQGVKTPENEDRLKQLQLMELAVLNDKDRQQATIQQQAQFQQQLLLQQQAAVAAQQLQTSLNPGATATSPVSLAGLTAQQQLALLQNPSAFLARYSAGSQGVPAMATSPNAMMMATIQQQFNPAVTYGLSTGSTGPIDSLGLGYLMGQQHQTSAAASYDSLQAAAALLCGGSATSQAAAAAQSLLMPSSSPTLTASSQAGQQTCQQQATVTHANGTNPTDILSMASVAANFPLSHTISAQASLNMNAPSVNGTIQSTDVGQASALGTAYEVSAAAQGGTLKMRAQTQHQQQAQNLRMHPYLR